MLCPQSPRLKPYSRLSSAVAAVALAQGALVPLGCLVQPRAHMRARAQALGPSPTAGLARRPPHLHGSRCPGAPLMPGAAPRPHVGARSSPQPKPYIRLGSAVAAVAWLEAPWRPSVAWCSPALTHAGGRSSPWPKPYSRLGSAAAAFAWLKAPWRPSVAWCSPALTHAGRRSSPWPKPYSRLGSAAAALAWLKAPWRPSVAWCSPALACGRALEPSAPACGWA